MPVLSQVSPGRIKDWFKLLSLEPDRGRFGCYIPICKTEKWINRWGFIDRAGDRLWPAAGAVYAISAVKRVAGIRLVGPAWRKKSRKLGRHLVAPVAKAKNTHN